LRIHEQELEPKLKPTKQWVYPTIDSPHVLESLTLDASSMQYGRRVKSHRSSTYTAKREGLRRWNPEEFGYTYAMWSTENGSEILTHDYVEVAAREMNDAVWKEVQRLGGRQKLLLASHDRFVRSRDKIGRIVCGVLELLRLEFATMVIDRRLEYPLNRLLRVAEDSGHQKNDEHAVPVYVITRSSHSLCLLLGDSVGVHETMR
jgi:hypothetical protein